MSVPRSIALVLVLVMGVLFGGAAEGVASISSVTIQSPLPDYVPGQGMAIAVTFNETVQVTGAPSFLLNASSSATASYISGSGTKVLIFAYIVASGDHTPSSGLDVATSVTLQVGPTGTDFVDPTNTAHRPAAWSWPSSSGNLTPTALIAPVVQSIALSPGATAPGTVSCVLTGSEALAGLSAANITLSGAAATGAALGTITTNASLNTVTVPITVATSGPLTVTLSSGTGIADTLGNALDLSQSVTTASTTVLPVPTLQSITTTTASPTAGASAIFILGFNVPVQNVTSGMMSWTGGLTVGSTVVSPSSGLSSVWTVAASGISGTGTLGLTYTGAGTTSDASGNLVQAASPSPDQTVAIDQTAPTIASITAPASSTGPNDATTRTYTVTFSTAITGFTTGSCSVTTTGTAAAAVGSVSPLSPPSAHQYAVQLTGCSGAGTVQLVISPTGISDTLGNAMLTAPSAPTCTVVAVPVVSWPSSTPATNASSFTVTLPANVTLTGTDPTGGITLQTTGGVGAAITGVTTGGSHAVVAIGSVSGTGTLALVVPATLAGITDSHGDAVTSTIGTSAPITIDQTAPTMTAITLATASPSNAASATFQVSFSESVQGVTTGSFAATGSVGGTISGVTTGSSGTTALVTISGLSGSGTIGIGLSGSSGITDLAGNALSTTLPGTDATGLVERSAPTLTAITAIDANPAGVPGTVHYLATFSVPVANVTAADFAVTGTLQGTPTIAVAPIGSAPAASWIVTVSGLALPSGTTSTTLALTFSNASSVQDQVGNAASSTAPATDILYTLVTQLPTVTAAGAVTYVEQGAAALPFGNATLSDPGTSNFVNSGQSGAIDVALSIPGSASVAPHTSSSDALDQIWLAPGATTASVIWTLDTPVVVAGAGPTSSTTTANLRLFGGIVGSVRYSNDLLHIALTAPVFTSQAQALIGCISYFNPGNNPSNTSRQLAITVTDGLGRISAVTSVQTTMALINDAAPLVAGVPLITTSPAARILAAGGVLSGHIATNDVDSYFTCIVIDGAGHPHAATAGAPAVVATTQGTITVQQYGDWSYAASTTASGIDSFSIQVTDIGPGQGSYDTGASAPLLAPATITQSVYCVQPQSATGLESPAIISNPPVEAEVGAAFSYQPTTTLGIDACASQGFDIVDLDGNGWVSQGILIIDPVYGTVTSTTPLPTTTSGYVEIGILYQVTDLLGTTRATYQPVLLRLVSSLTGGG